MQDNIDRCGRGAGCSHAAVTARRLIRSSDIRMPMLAAAGRFPPGLRSPAAGGRRLMLWAKILSESDGATGFYFYKEQFSVISAVRAVRVNRGGRERSLW
jgi:hypothetical protein